ncbi:MG2 domain-containing protein [Sediminibacterium ginsengisoli]|nr:MG2 domain-containing protein [Sediminibacterium ginsengisoli]
MRSLLPAILLCMFCQVSFSQANTTISPDSALSLLNSNYPQEKVFLQTDKAQYVAGETIWMKAWCTLEGQPSFLSRILYVDLVNSNGKVIQKKMYKLDSLSSTPAEIDIPKEAGTGNYSVNAYTLWMRNFPQYLFKKDIYIYNSDYGTKPRVYKAPSVKVQFLPEGGNLVAGLTNRIAFKALDENGFPVDVKGDIVDNTGKKIMAFATGHDGMGSLELEVEAGKTYTATMPVAGGNTLQFKLPAPQEDGITVRVENGNANRLVVLLNRAEKNKAKYGKLIVVAQMNHQLVVRAALNLDEGQLALPIAKKGLPAGIMQVTVFNEQYEPLAERLAFIENYQLQRPDVKIETLNKTARANSQISFSVDAKPAALSCLVTSAYTDTITGIAENIASSLLVTSDLQGYVHNPGYYFKDKQPATLHDLDLLMMTQGWRRFEWKKILHNEFAKLDYLVESAISFGGIVTKSDRKEVVKEGKVSFIIKGADSTSMLAEASITDKGEFLLKDINYMREAKVAYMGTNSKQQGFIVDVKIRPNYIDSLTKSAGIPFLNLDTTDVNNRKSLLAQYLYGQIHAIDTLSKEFNYLGNVTVKSKRVSKEDSLNREYAGGPFLMGRGIDPADYKFARNIWSIIQQAVPGVTVEGNPFDPDVSFSRFAGLGGGDATVDDELSSMGVMQTNGIAFFLNEVNVTKDVVNTILPEDVALIKVLKNEGAALGASQGAIAIYTKKGYTPKSAPYEKSYTIEKKAGYSVAREFYAPDYSKNEEVLTEKDRRTTLYWNGHIAPAKDGKYRFRFSNNDLGDKFRLVIQGLDKQGNLIYSEQIIR